MPEVDMTTQVDLLLTNPRMDDPCDRCGGRGKVTSDYIPHPQVPYDYVDKECLKCHGTGKRHQWAWERCPAETQHCGNATCEDCRDCYGGCNGSGFVLAVTEAKVFKAARDALVGQILIHFVPLAVEVTLYMEFSSEEYEGEGTSILAAALDAMRQLEA